MNLVALIKEILTRPSRLPLTSVDKQAKVAERLAQQEIRIRMLDSKVEAQTGRRLQHR